MPVIQRLAKRLELHRLRNGNPQSGPIFGLDLANLPARVMKPALQKAGIVWYGWHAARRGLGSNLYRLGVPAKLIQRILRHSNVNSTATYYILSAEDDVRTAMQKMEQSLNVSYMAASEREPKEPESIN